MYKILGKSDNYRQATQANPGDPPADKDPLKAANPKTTAKPRLGLSYFSDKVGRTKDAHTIKIAKLW